ncbi:hypothetical protein [Chroococcidiopsis sp.]
MTASMDDLVKTRSLLCASASLRDITSQQILPLWTRSPDSFGFVPNLTR